MAPCINIIIIIVIIIAIIAITIQKTTPTILDASK
jgi:hypothetical protein